MHQVAAELQDDGSEVGLGLLIFDTRKKEGGYYARSKWKFEEMTETTLKRNKLGKIDS